MTFRKKLFASIISAVSASILLPAAACAGDKLGLAASDNIAKAQISKLSANGIQLAQAGQCDAADQKARDIVQIIHENGLSIRDGERHTSMENEIIGMFDNLSAQRKKCKIIASLGTYKMPDYSHR